MGSVHAATLGGMRDALLRVPGVTSARVEERGKLDLEVFVAGGDDQQVAEAIWCAKAAFIGTVGNHSVQMPYGPISFSREGETTAYRQDAAEEEARAREITGAILQGIKGMLKRGAGR